MSTRVLALFGAMIALAMAGIPARAQFTIVQITDTDANVDDSDNVSPAFSLNGTAIAFLSHHDLVPGSNPTEEEQVFRYDRSGFFQVSRGTLDSNDQPALDHLGNHIVFRSTSSDLAPGLNGAGISEIFRFALGTGFTQLTTSVGGNNIGPAVNGNGTRVAFSSAEEVLVPGANADENFEIFLFTEGSGITQITNTLGGTNGHPSIDASGTRIAFDSTRDLVPGSNADGTSEIFLFTQGVGFVQITSSASGGSDSPSLSADGTRIAFLSLADLVPGGNTEGHRELFLFTQGSGFIQITNSIDGSAANGDPSLSADGTRIAFESRLDLVPGGNGDGNHEIFLFTEGSGITQVTNSVGVTGSLSPQISGDGVRIVFHSDASLVGSGNSDENFEIYLATSATLPSATLVDGGNSQVTEVSTAFPLELAVVVTDVNGSPVPGVLVGFGAPASGASAIFEPATPVLTDAFGIARVTATANGLPGSYSVVAAVVSTRGVLNADFDLTNLAPGVVAEVPTLSQWGMGAMVLVLCAFAARELRARRRSTA